MIIDLDTKHRIRSDAQCWRLEEEYVDKNGPGWRALGYYSSFKSAIAAAYEREVRTTHAEGMTEILEAMDKILAKYVSILDATALPDVAG